jgi:hypothetical protein
VQVKLFPLDSPTGRLFIEAPLLAAHGRTIACQLKTALVARCKLAHRRRTSSRQPPAVSSLAAAYHTTPSGPRVLSGCLDAISLAPALRRFRASPARRPH